MPVKSGAAIGRPFFLIIRANNAQKKPVKGPAKRKKPEKVLFF